MKDRSLLLRCRAGCFHFLEFNEWDWSKDKTLLVDITVVGKTFWQRIKAAIQALRGVAYGASEEIVLYEEDVKKLKKWMEKL